jgi:phage shock protein A
MKLARGLAIGLAACLAGCDSEVHEQMEAEVKTLQARCEAAKREGDTAKASADRLMAENAAMERKQYGLGAENDSLKKQVEAERVAAAQKVEQLTKDLAAAKRGLAVLSAAPDTAPSTPGTSATPAAPATPMTAKAAAVLGSATPPVADAAPVADADGESVAELEKTQADLEARIAALQPKIGQAETKIGVLARGKVDERMVPPAGGKIENGQVYRREVHNDWSYYGPYYYGPNYGSHYEYVAIGPAVKTHDFRTQHDKEAAIQKVKEETLPLYQERKALQDELAAIKAKLAKLRTGKAGK